LVVAVCAVRNFDQSNPARRVGQEKASLAQVTDACPPPCVPSVFSQQEAAELSGGMDKGKPAVPAGDEAVEEAMRAANDASNHFQISGGGSSSPQLRLEPSSLPDAAAVSSFYHPVSQWAKMHPLSSKLQAQQINSEMQQPQSSGFLRLGSSRGETGGVSAEKQRKIQKVEDELKSLLTGATSGKQAKETRRSERPRHPLSKALDRMSKRRLKGVVRSLLRGEGQYLSDGGYGSGGLDQLAGSWGDHTGYVSLRDRFRAEDEDLELHHLREAEDLSYRTSDLRRSRGSRQSRESDSLDSLLGSGSRAEYKPSLRQDDSPQSKAKRLLALLEGTKRGDNGAALEIKPAAGKARVQLLANIPRSMQRSPESEDQSNAGAAKGAAKGAVKGAAPADHLVLDTSTQTVLKALERIAKGKK